MADRWVLLSEVATILVTSEVAARREECEGSGLQPHRVVLLLSGSTQPLSNKATDVC